MTRGAVPAAAPETKLMEQQVGYVKVPILNKGRPRRSRPPSATRSSAARSASSRLTRGSAGGELKEGVTVADYFLKSGTISKTIGRKDKVLATTRPSRTTTSPSYPSR